MEGSTEAFSGVREDRDAFRYGFIINQLITTKMKRTVITTFVIALATLQGCEKPIENQKDRMPAKVRFDLKNTGQYMTKLTNLGEESAINKAKLFIYTSDGKYITGLDGKASAEIELYEGRYSVAALVNTPADMDDGEHTIPEAGNLEAALENNTTGNLIMYGEHDFEVKGSINDITLPVRRTVGRITVNAISNRMKDPIHQKQEFIIKRVFVSNVSGVSDLRGEKSPTLWYNKNGVWSDESQTVKTLLEDSGIEYKLPYQEDYSTSHSFYVYPNDTAGDSYEAEWSPRFTRLVIEASIGGDICYYPIPIGGIESNHTYTINRLTITKPGTDNPWENVDGELCSFTITVTDWEEGLTTDKTI